MTLRIGLCFANRPAVANANLGFAIVRQLVSTFGSDALVDLRYAQPPKKPHRPLTNYDLLLFSVPFEGDYARLVHMLDQGGVEPLWANRGSGPLIVVGGFAPTLNPEPLAQIADLICIGDAEDLLPDLAETIAPLVRAGARHAEILDAATEVEGVYVPRHYSFEFADDGHITAINNSISGEPAKTVQRRFASNLNLSSAPVIADDEIFAGCAVVEASRGCLWGCRFCAAGYAQRPYREHSAETLWPRVKQALGQKPRIGLVGADIGDLSYLDQLAQQIHSAGGTLTPAALRADAIDAPLAKALVASGKKTATLAPETASQRLRTLINKHLDDNTLMQAVERLASAGIENLRLYFMMGLPTEEERDIDALVELALRCRDTLLQHGRTKGRVGKLFLSVTPFVPKPGTPFQWQPFADPIQLRRSSQQLRRALARQPNIQIKIEPIARAQEQAILSRADRRLGGLLLNASRSDLPLRQVLLEQSSITRGPLGGFAQNAILPWQLVNHGPGRDFLWREWQRALAGKTTPPCDLKKCVSCGIACGKAR